MEYLAPIKTKQNFEDRFNVNNVDPDEPNEDFLLNYVRAVNNSFAVL